MNNILVSKEVDGQHKLFLAPGGKMEEEVIYPEFHPLGINIYDIDLEGLRERLAEVFAKTGSNVKDPNKFDSNLVQRAILTSLVSFVKSVSN